MGWIDRVLVGPLSGRRRHTMGAKAFRLVIGIVLIYQFMILVGQYDLLFGQHGVEDFSHFRARLGADHFSYLALSDSPSWHLAGYYLGVLVIWVWTIGRGGWISTALVWWVVHSLHARCPGLWDGGDNLIGIVLIYAVALDLTGRQRGGTEGPRVRTILHNAAVFACAIQVCIMYFNAGVAKLPGKYWQNGTALYYVLSSQEFGVTGLGPLIWNNGPLLAALTWGPVLLQVSFPWVYLFGTPRPRRLWVVSAIAFHLGILLFMGLNTFALMMIGVELLLLSDSDFHALAGSVAQVGRGMRDAARWASAPFGSLALRWSRGHE